MAQQAAQQREPSREPTMEEILASIRRIIEDSEPLARDTVTDVETAIGPAANDVAPSPVVRPAPVVEAPQIDEPRYEEPRQAAPQHQAPRAEAPPRYEPPRQDGPRFGQPRQAPLRPPVDTPRPVSAEPRVFSPKPQMMSRAPLAQPKAEPVAAPRVVQEAAPRVVQEAAPRPIAADLRPTIAPTPAPAPVEEVDIDMAAITAAVEEETAQWDADFLKSLDQKSTPASAAPRAGTALSANKPSSIISPRAGRQVAASFGELSGAFAASRSRRFDELATDMMRPMLQEWLDNNLPLLVEKLVREEIERVARGTDDE